MLLPFIGYFVGWLMAILFKQNYEDRLAIAVEAGIQNTGISIFILKLALGQPEADLTTVVPVAVAIMTPFPLMAYYLCYKGRELYVSHLPFFLYFVEIIVSFFSCSQRSQISYSQLSNRNKNTFNPTNITPILIWLLNSPYFLVKFCLIYYLVHKFGCG